MLFMFDSLLSSFPYDYYAIPIKPPNIDKNPDSKIATSKGLSIPVCGREP